MKILGIDLSSRTGSLAVYCGGNALLKQEWPNDRRSSAPFFHALQNALHEQGAPEMIVVGLGPGSYTGTRIAISAAIGLQLASGAQLGGLPSVCAMSREKNFAVVGDAKRASFFFARIEAGEIAGDIALLSVEQARQRIAQAKVPVFSADDLPRFENVRRASPCAELLCEIAHGRAENLAHPPLEPIYLRGPHITAPRAATTK